jgi:hypothetical protein
MTSLLWKFIFIPDISSKHSRRNLKWINPLVEFCMEDDGVVSILHVGHSLWDQMWHYPLDMASRPGLGKDCIKRIHHEVEQQQGDGISLVDPSPVAKVRTNISVD